MPWLRGLIPRWDVYDRRDSFRLQLFCLVKLGLWPPELSDESSRRRYIAYGWVLRVVFLHLFILSQALYFKDVQDINDIANALFITLTQLVLAYKLENFVSNTERIRACLRKVNCTLYHPKQLDEFGPIIRSNKGVFWLMVTPWAFAMVAISMWLLLSAFGTERRLLISAWFPVEYKTSYTTYVVLCLYQLVGAVMSATYNFSSETIFSGLLLHVNGQMKRLGCMMRKVGHEGLKGHRFLVEPYECDDEWQTMRERIEHHARVDGKAYSEVIECVLLHKDILSFADEVQDIYQGSSFAQMCGSVLIICMTIMRFTNKTATVADLAAGAFYLGSMITQVFIFCYVGNEITYSTGQITECVGFCNYTTFDTKTRKALIFFMQMTLKDIHLNVGSIMQITLNLHTFLQIMKMSYSYVSVLRGMSAE